MQRTRERRDARHNRNYHPLPFLLLKTMLSPMTTPCSNPLLSYVEAGEDDLIHLHRMSPLSSLSLPPQSPTCKFIVCTDSETKFFVNSQLFSHYILSRSFFQIIQTDTQEDDDTGEQVPNWCWCHTVYLFHVSDHDNM